MKVFAQFISLVFHPIFVPTYAILFLVWCNPYEFGQMDSYDAFFIIRTAVLYSILYPLFVVVLMRLLDFIDSYEMRDRKNRILVFIPTSFFLWWTFIVFLKSDYNEILSDVMLGATISISIALVVTSIFSKISLHAIGMGGLFAIVLFSVNIAAKDVSMFLFASIFVAGLVGTCRMWLDAHDLREVYNGYLVGFLSMLFAFIV
ncbi:MAG: hypothetical protein R3E32_16780 [Chitinophagales bacterium]